MSVSYSDKLDKMVLGVENEFLRSVLRHCTGKKKLPYQCVVDGAIERMINEIVNLEREAKAWRTYAANADKKGNS